MGLFDFLGLGGTDAPTDSGVLDNLGLDTSIGNYVPAVFDYFSGSDANSGAGGYSAPTPMHTAAMGPALAPIAQGIAGLASRFPALYTFMMAQRAKGIPVSADKLYTMLKKFGPVFLTGLMGAQAVQELMMYRATRKRRRMNALNQKALGRATRRLCSFQNKAAKVSAALGGLVRHRAKRRGGHCFRCKRSPCAC